MFNTFYTLSPLITQQYSPRLQVIFRQHIQPWHPSSTLTHEAGAAVLRLAPEKFWDFSAALFKRQTEFFDVSLVNETRNKTYERLAQIAGSVGVDERKILELLKIPESPGDDGQLNIGNQVTNDIKLMIKVGSQALDSHIVMTF
jgi:protein-disulfide isomerase